MSGRDVTVILPVRNRGQEVLRKSVESVQANTLQGVRIIVVDDASEIALEPQDGVDLIRNERRLGVAGSLNRALEETTSPFVARLDAGDLMMPERLERQLSAMDGYDVCGTAMKFHDSTGAARGMTPAVGIDALTMGALLWFQNGLGHPSTMIRRSSLPPAGYPLVDKAEDWALWLTMLARGAYLGVIGEHLTSYEVDVPSESRSADGDKAWLRPRTAVFQAAGMDFPLADRWVSALSSSAPIPQEVVDRVRWHVPEVYRTVFVDMAERLNASR